MRDGRREREERGGIMLGGVGGAEEVRGGGGGGEKWRGEEEGCPFLVERLISATTAVLSP